MHGDGGRGKEEEQGEVDETGGRRKGGLRKVEGKCVEGGGVKGEGGGGDSRLSIPLTKMMSHFAVTSCMCVVI